MFKCDKCGLCCQALATVDMLAHLDRGDGICKFYISESKLCSIYDTRPLLCRVDECYDAIFAKYMSKEEYEQINYHACQQLKSMIAQK